MEYIADINELNKKLAAEARDYVLQTGLPATRVELQFAGPFQQQTVVWNACIITLNEYAKTQQVESDPKQFIDIHQKNGCYQLLVGLNIEQIDQATIERTIIMIRKYKRLNKGRHEYGAKSKCQPDD